MAAIDEELQLLEVKIKQLKLDYEHYFLGTRPREPIQLRGEVQKTILRHTNQPIQNTAARPANVARRASRHARYGSPRRVGSATTASRVAWSYDSTVRRPA